MSIHDWPTDVHFAKQTHIRSSFRYELGTVIRWPCGGLWEIDKRSGPEPDGTFYYEMTYLNEAQRDLVLAVESLTIPAKDTEDTALRIRARLGQEPCSYPSCKGRLKDAGVECYWCGRA